MARYIGKLGLVAAAYIVATLASFGVQVPDVLANPIWPAAGVAYAALRLGGYALWPGVWVGAFVYSYAVCLSPSGVLPSALLACGVTLSAVAILYLFRNNPVTNGGGGLKRLVSFVSAVTTGSFMSPAIGTLTLEAIGTLAYDAWAVTFLFWWIGDVVGVLVVGSAIVVWGLGHARPLGLKVTFSVPLVATAIAIGVFNALDADAAWVTQDVLIVAQAVAVAVYLACASLALWRWTIQGA